jgi:hypothetical protein|tara:strand:- start:283 stop:651 length:369 start_codon:yes stop_codon:yes gene_type:complete
VCREKGKPTQIHHINDDPSDNLFENLAVLCLDCHNETQIKGGFARKLDSDQVVLFRDDWLTRVVRQRTTLAAESNSDESRSEWRLRESSNTIEAFKANEEYELLAMHFDVIGNEELRDKYIN